MSAIGGAVGGVVGGFMGQGDKERQEKQYNDARAAANGYDTHAAGQGGTEYDRIDPTSRDAMMQGLSDYEAKVKGGGLDSVAKANLAQGTAAGEQAAQQSAAQIQAEAARRGEAQGPAAMVAQQVAAQQGAERSRQTGLASAALAEQARDAALKGQMGAAGQIHGADAERAQAQDAINQFNVRNAQQNIGNDRAKAGQLIGIDTGEAGMYGQRAAATQKQMGDMGAGIGGVADFGMGGGFDGIAKMVKGGGGGSDGGWDDNSTGAG